MGAYDTMTAGLSGAGLALLSIITVHGTSEYHLNAEQMQAQLQDAAEQALLDAGQTWAKVEMQGQTAILSGVPPSESAAEAALQAVQTSSGQGGLIWGGVIRVETAFDAPDTLAAVERLDVVEQAVTVETMSAAKPYVWRAIKSPKGAIILVGSVPNDQVEAVLTGHAVSLSDSELDNRMKITAGAPQGDWAKMATFGLNQLSLLDSGEARLTGYELRVSGIALDDRNRIQATASVANLKNPWRGMTKIDGPSLWKAEHVDGQLVISGAGGTREARAELVQIAQTYFDGEVIDQMNEESPQQSGWVEYVSLDQSRVQGSEPGQLDVSPDTDGSQQPEWSE